MRFVGIDVAAERHVVGIVDETGTVVLKPTPFAEDADGYQMLRHHLDAPLYGFPPPANASRIDFPGATPAVSSQPSRTGEWTPFS